MTLLVAIEGADGAGKHTASTGLRDALTARGYSACVLSFPRYQETVGGFALGEFLSGRLPTAPSARAAAVLYALDRLESIEVVVAAASAHDVVIFDRYIASNMVYQASKVPAAQAGDFMKWIWGLEVKTFGVLPPDVSVYLDTSLEHARKLMRLKQRRSYTERTLDEHEADLALQQRVRRNYAAIAKDGRFGPWHVVRSEAAGGLRCPEDIVKEIVDRLAPHLDVSAQDASRRITA